MLSVLHKIYISKHLIYSHYDSSRDFDIRVASNIHISPEFRSRGFFLWNCIYYGSKHSFRGS